LVWSGSCFKWLTIGSIFVSTLLIMSEMSRLMILIYLGKSGRAFMTGLVGSFGGSFSHVYTFPYSVPLVDARSAYPTEPVRAYDILACDELPR
jgi:hypothetical protein